MSSLADKIRLRFESDQKRPWQALRRTDVPMSYQAFTTEWLTEVLCGAAPGAKVVSFDLGEPDNGVSNRRRISLKYTGSSPGELPASVFCKAAHDLQNRVLFAVSGCGHAEVTFYNRVRPELQIEAPRCFFANYDPESGTSVILLKDMADAEFCREHTQIDRSRAQDMVELLATLHGTYFESERLRDGSLGFLTWPQFWDNNISLGMEEFTNRGFLAAEAVIPPRLFRRYPEIWPATMKSVRRHSELPQTLTHSDVHLKNWYVTAGNRMGLNDWQNTCVGHWSRDLAYSMSTALTVENRRAWEEELVRAYLDKLAASGGPSVPFDEAWLNFRQQLMSALAYWTVTLTPSPDMPDMQPRGVTFEFIRRMSQAIDDHESLDSF